MPRIVENYSIVWSIILKNKKKRKENERKSKQKKEGGKVVEV